MNEFFCISRTDTRYIFLKDEIEGNPSREMDLSEAALSLNLTIEINSQSILLLVVCIQREQAILLFHLITPLSKMMIGVLK